MKAAIFGGPRDISVGERRTRASRTRATPSSASRWPASAARTSGTIPANPRTRSARSATSSSAWWSRSGSRARHRQARPRRRPLHVLRRHLRPLPRGLDVELRGRAVRNHGIDGGQGEAVRVPFADATLVRVPGTGHSDASLRSLLTLSDVICTGHHAAASGGVGPGMSWPWSGTARWACAPSSRRRLGAARIIALSRNPARQAVARGLVPPTSSPSAATRRRGGPGSRRHRRRRCPGCVGTGQSMATAFAIRDRARSSGRLAPPTASRCRSTPYLPQRWPSRRRPPARRYIPELLPTSWTAACSPAVFDFEPTSTHRGGVPGDGRGARDQGARARRGELERGAVRPSKPERGSDTAGCPVRRRSTVRSPP